MSDEHGHAGGIVELQQAQVLRVVHERGVSVRSRWMRNGACVTHGDAIAADLFFRCCRWIRTAGYPEQIALGAGLVLLLWASVGQFFPCGCVNINIIHLLLDELKWCESPADLRVVVKLYAQGSGIVVGSFMQSVIGFH